MEQNKLDLVQALKSVSMEVAMWTYNQFENGKSFDEVTSQLKNAVKVVEGWRIGRGV